MDEEAVSRKIIIFMAQNGQADRETSRGVHMTDTSGGMGREGWGRVIVEEVKRVRDLRCLALLRPPLSAKLNPLAQGSPASRLPLQLARARQHYNICAPLSPSSV